MPVKYLMKQEVANLVGLATHQPRWVVPGETTEISEFFLKGLSELCG